MLVEKRLTDFSACPELQGTSFPQHVSMLRQLWQSGLQSDDNLPQVPVFLDLLSGPQCPLSHAFHSAGWRVLQPIDFLIDAAFDVTDVVVQQAIGKVLPECHLVSAAIDCSTKSRIREIKLSGGRGPRPLRSTQFPRGLPQLAVHEASRVASDNACSDFLLAVQHVLAEHGRGAFRENPSNSLHWDDPVGS